jgi:hypothetical protein
MNDLDLLRSLGTDLEPDDTVPPPRIRHQLVSQLTTRRPARRTPAYRGRTAWALSAAASVAVAAMVATGVLHTTNSGQPAVTAGGDRTADLTAPQALMLAAQHAGLASAATGTYWMTATETHELKLAGTDGNLYKLDDASTTEHWTAKSGSDTGRTGQKSLSMVPATAADRAAWQRAGSPATVDLHELDQNLKPTVKKNVPLKADSTFVAVQPARDTVHGATAAKAGSSFTIGNQLMSLPQIRQLPSDQARLRKILLSGYPAGAKQWNQDRWLFSTAADVLTQPVTPGVRASIYRILAGLPSVHSAGQVKDITGRAGTAIALTWSGPRGAEEDRLIIDVKAGSLLARETRLIRPIAAYSWLKPADLWQTTVITRAGWTDDTPPAPVDPDKPAKTLTLNPVHFAAGAATIDQADAGYLTHMRDKLTTAKVITCTGYADADANAATGLARAKVVCAIVAHGLKATVHVTGKTGNDPAGHVDITVTR